MQALSRAARRCLVLAFAASTYAVLRSSAQSGGLIFCDTPVGCPSLSFRTAPPVPVGFSPTLVLIGDFNEDGKADLVVGESGEIGDSRDTIQVLLGNGDGTFEGGVIYSGLLWAFSGVVSDLNQDGHLDLTLVGSDSGHEWVMDLLSNSGHRAFVNCAAGPNLLAAARIFKIHPATVSRVLARTGIERAEK